MTGRVEVYIHSDSITANKGAAMIRVLSQSDFAARTDEFINFCKAAARYAYAANTETWTDVVLAYPEIEMSRISLQTTLREKIEVDCILIMTL